MPTYARPGKRSIDPRKFVVEHGPAALGEYLRVHASYVPQVRPLRALSKSLRRSSAILLEGIRGSGKTALGEAMGEAFNLTVYYLQCDDGISKADILGEWDRTSQNQHVAQQLTAGVKLKQAQGEQWTKDFFEPGEVLEGFIEASRSLIPPVIIIDEIDKLLRRTANYLLQVLARGYANVARLKPDSRLGVLPEKFESGDYKSHLPIIILTSNDMFDGVDTTIRSRCRYAYIDYPTPAEEAGILHTRVPSAPFELVLQTVKMMHAIRGRGDIVEKPGIRESREFLETLVDERVHRIDANVIVENVDCLVKTKNDVINLDNGADNVARTLDLRHEEIDAYVVRAFSLSGATIPPAYMRYLVPQQGYLKQAPTFGGSNRR
jgi:MoxR-like ATPase